MRQKYAVLFLLWLIPVIWMGFIFSLSAETAAESSETSGSLLSAILSVLNDEFDSYSAEEQKALVENYSFLIRKAAHFSVYAALGFFLSNVFDYQNRIIGIKRNRFCVVPSIAVGGLYAVSDEIHQYFVPGRSCEVRDMIIDTAGVLLGVVCSRFLIHFLEKKKKA